MIDGYIFYLNPLQRFASNELWDLLRRQTSRSSRCGRFPAATFIGCVTSRAAWKDYLRQAPSKSPRSTNGRVARPGPFCVRFAYGFPQVRATVCSTSRPENLRAFLDAAKNIKPLPDDIQSEIIAAMSLVR